MYVSPANVSHSENVYEHPGVTVMPHTAYSVLALSEPAANANGAHSNTVLPSDDGEGEGDNDGDGVNDGDGDGEYVYSDALGTLHFCAKYSSTASASDALSSSAKCKYS